MVDYESKIKELIRDGRSIPEIQRELRIGDYLILDVMVNQLGKWKQSDDGRGPRHLRKHIVAIRHVDGDWPKNDAIQIARRKYDNGDVEMAQGRDGFHIILYAFPRKRRAKRVNPWFARMEPV